MASAYSFEEEDFLEKNAGKMTIVEMVSNPAIKNRSYQALRNKLVDMGLSKKSKRPARTAKSTAREKVIFCLSRKEKATLKKIESETGLKSKDLITTLSDLIEDCRIAQFGKDGEFYCIQKKSIYLKALRWPMMEIKARM